jgi:hypothetical protein
MRYLNILFALLYSHITIAQDDVIHASYRGTTPTIDGLSSDWAKPFRYYDGKSKLQFAANYNQDNLYLCIRIADELAQRKALLSGIQLWIDATGKKKYRCGIGCPMTHKLDLDAIDLPYDISQNPTALKRRIVSQIKQMELQGWTNPADGIVPTTHTSGIMVAIAMDSLGVLAAEYVIPRVLLGVPVDSIRPIAIGIIAKGLEGGAINTASKLGREQGADVGSVTDPSGAGLGQGALSQPTAAGRGIGGLPTATMPTSGSIGAVTNDAALEVKHWYKVKLGGGE